MRKTALTVVAVVLVTVATSAYQHEEPGFRGHEWGMAVPEGWGQPVETDDRYGGITLYNAPGEDRALGCAQLESVEYGFWQERLSDVRVKFEGFVNHQCVLRALQDKFGDGVQPKDSVEYYVWAGGVTTIILQYAEKGKEGSVTLTSKGISNEQKAWEKAHAKK